MVPALRTLLNFGLPVFVLLQGCGSSGIETPEVIGEKLRTAVIKGSEAGKAINQLHGLEVATAANLIAEYGGEPKDLLYISSFKTGAAAKQALDLMTEKIAHSKGGPFFHVMPLKEYAGGAFITLGMGATHYIFVSGQLLIWFQTYQAFGPKLPEELTTRYPVAVTG